MSPTPTWTRCLLLALLAPAGLFAQQLYVKAYNIDAGLPQSNVTSVVQTRDAYLWVGTEGGLARFDGLRFVSFRTSTTSALDSDSIRCLLEDHDGSLWIGTEAGLVRLRDRHFERIGLTGASIRALAQDASGKLWVGTFGEGLYQWNGTALARVDKPNDLPTPRVTSLCPTPEGRLWIGTEWTNGPVCLEHGRFFRDPDLQAISGRITAMYCEADGTMWFGAYHHGVYRLHEGQLTESLPLAGMTVTDIRGATGGGLWVTAGKVYRAETSGQPVFTPLEGIASDQVHALCEDREGGLWFGCGRADGLLSARPIPFRAISVDDGLPANAVRTVSGGPDGSLWLTILNTPVTCYSLDGSVKTFGPAEGFPPGEPSVVFAASDGTIWSGIGGRLYRWKAGTGTSYAGINSVYGLFEDSHHTIWIGTRNEGVFACKLNSEEPTLVLPQIHYATSFCEQKDGSLLIGTWETGIYRVMGGAIAETFSRTNGLPVNEVRALFIDREGVLWAGFKGRGLAPRIDGRWLNPNLLSEAVADHVSAIAEDSRGVFWLGTAAGILFAPRAEILAAAKGDGPVPKMRVAMVVGGAPTAAAWSGTQPGVWTTRKGTFMFATRHGIIEIDPSKPPANPIPPPVQIESIELDRRPFDVAGAVRMPAGTRNLAITYTALSFIQPARIQFRYRMEGYDPDWVDAQAMRTASYSHLPPGDYVFRVKACNSDGIWSAPSEGLMIVQEPYFYQTRWFRGLALIGILSGTWGANRWSHRRLRRRTERLEARQQIERERNRIARNLHDDLGANLTALGLLADRVAVRLGGTEMDNDARQLRRRVSALVGSLDAVVWTIDPSNDSLEGLVGYLCGLFQELLCLAEIGARLDVDGPIPEVNLSPEERSNLFLVAKEATNNAIKHSGASEVWLRIRATRQAFSMTIEDNGRGFNPFDPRHRQRNGLSNMQSRLAEIGGTLELTTNALGGTTVRATVPFNPSAQ